MDQTAEIIAKCNKINIIYNLANQNMEKIVAEMTQQGLTMEVDRQQFALALKTWRLRAGYTQREVAAMWGVSRKPIMMAEAAKPITWEMAYRLFSRLSDELRKEAQHE